MARLDNKIQHECPNGIVVEVALFVTGSLDPLATGETSKGGWLPSLLAPQLAAVAAKASHAGMTRAWLGIR